MEMGILMGQTDFGKLEDYIDRFDYKKATKLTINGYIFTKTTTSMEIILQVFPDASS